MTRRATILAAIAVALAAGTVALYAQVRHHDFVDFDDRAARLPTRHRMGDTRGAAYAASGRWADAEAIASRGESVAMARGDRPFVEQLRARRAAYRARRAVGGP
jgi:hypothetical protein